MSLISIDAIAAEAKANGFQVREYLLGRGGRGFEIFAPDHAGPHAYWHEGALYTAAGSFQICDRTSYGYNDWFCGPWHDGFAQSDDYGVRKLYEHPAMRRSQEAA